MKQTISKHFELMQCATQTGALLYITLLLYTTFIHQSMAETVSTNSVLCPSNPQKIYHLSGPVQFSIIPYSIASMYDFIWWCRSSITYCQQYTYIVFSSNSYPGGQRSSWGHSEDERSPSTPNRLSSASWDKYFC